MLDLLHFIFRSFWTFMGSFIILVFIIVFFEQLFNVIAKLVNRRFRHKNIIKHGWPPAHLDGDGDFKPEKTIN